LTAFSLNGIIIKNDDYIIFFAKGGKVFTLEDMDMVWDETFNFSQMNKDVLLVGEVVIDLIRNDNSNLSAEIIGGSPFNICKNLTKLGVKNHFYGAVGNDAYGEMILNQINAYKIDAEINVTDKPTSYVKLNQTISSPLPIFFRSADSDILLNEQMIQDASSTKILHFTYWTLSKEPSLSTILSLIDKAKECNALIGFDPNYHPFIDDAKRDGYKTIRAIIDKVDIIKPSLDDSQRLFGLKSVDDYLQIYEELGPKLIIMTLGKDGLIARYKGQTLKMPSIATDIVDSTGAGDAFWSGLYTGITNKQTIFDSLKLGLICSSMKLKTVGADFALPRYDKLIELIRR
jgi:sugar/nucleoside kinase (ribokinase family)